MTTNSEPSADEILSLIQNYLLSGGLHNPELMEHQKVRDMVMLARDEIEKIRAELAKEKAISEKLEKACEFYGDRDNWTPADDEYQWKLENKITTIDLDSYVPTGLEAEFECGGKLARQTLKEVSKIKQT